MASIVKRVSSGKVRYVARVRIVGHPERSRTFEHKADAKTWAEKAASDLKRGRDFPERQHQQRTLGELIKLYRAEGLPASCVHAYGPHLDWWAARLGSYRLADIRPALIAPLREEIAREPGPTNRRRGPYTVNRYLNTLSAVFSFGESEEVGWTDHNPVRKVKRKAEPEGRVRFLSRPADEPTSELERLLDACQQSRNRDLLDLVQLGILTGMREGEILGLRRSQVRLNEGGITLTADVTKGDEARFVPLVGPALAIVTRRFESGRQDYLFAPRRRRASRGVPRFPHEAWAIALRTAGITNFRFHDLRHTHASYLAMTGASIRELMDALGHKTPAMAVRYSHLADSHKREVAERVLNVGRDVFR